MGLGRWTQDLAGQLFLNPYELAWVGPEAHGTPAGGWGDTLSRGIAGVSAPLPFPRYVLPDGPPYLGARLCITLKALGVNLVVVKIGKNELNDTRVFLHVVIRHACRFFW